MKVLEKNIYVTGNTIVDAVKVITSISNENDIKNYLEKKLKINFKNKKDIILLLAIEEKILIKILRSSLRL